MTETTPKPSRRIPWWGYILGTFAAFTGFGMYLVHVEKQNYAKGHEAYLKGECDRAITSFDEIVKDRKVSKSEAPHVTGARREKAECVTYKTAQDKQKTGEHGAALAAYTKLTTDYSSSPLIKFAQGDVKSLFAKDKPEKLADAKSCSQVDKSPKSGLIPALDENLPSFLVACGRKLEDAKDFTKATQIYDNFLKSYPKHPLIGDAKAGLARSLVANANATGAGNLPAPQRSGNSSGSSSLVVVKNSSPNRIRIALSGAESRVEELEPCSKCEKFTEQNLPASCPKDGTVGEYAVKPGKYEVVVLSSDSSRVTPFKGTWDLSGGDKYSNCFYIVTKKGF